MAHLQRATGRPGPHAGRGHPASGATARRQPAVRRAGAGQRGPVHPLPQAAHPRGAELPDEPAVPADSAAGPGSLPGPLGRDLRPAVQLGGTGVVAGAGRDRAVLRDRRCLGPDQPELGRAGPGEPGLSVPVLHRDQDPARVQPRVRLQAVRPAQRHRRRSPQDGRDVPRAVPAAVRGCLERLGVPQQVAPGHRRHGRRDGGAGRGLDRGDRLGLHLHRHASHHRLQRHLRRQRLDGPVQRQPAAAVRRLLRADRPDRDPQPGPALPAVLSPISAGATSGVSRRCGTRRTRWGSVSGSSATEHLLRLSSLYLDSNPSVPQQPAAGGAVYHRADPGPVRDCRLAARPRGPIPLLPRDQRGTGSQPAPGGRHDGGGRSDPACRAGCAAVAGSPPGRGDCRAGGAGPDPRRNRWIRHELPGLADQGACRLPATRARRLRHSPPWSRR